MACTGCIASKWQRQRSNPESLPVESVVVNIEHWQDLCVGSHGRKVMSSEDAQ